MLIPRGSACNQMNSTKPLPAAWVAQNRALAAAVQQMVTRAQSKTNSIATRSPWDYRYMGLNVMADVYRSNLQNGAPGYVPPGAVIGSSTPGGGLIGPGGGAGSVSPGSAIAGGAGAGSTPAANLGPVNTGWWSGWKPGAVPGGPGSGPGGILSRTGLPPNPGVPGSWASPWRGRRTAGGRWMNGGGVPAAGGSWGNAGGGSPAAGGSRGGAGGSGGAGDPAFGGGYAAGSSGSGSGAATRGNLDPTGSVISTGYGPGGQGGGPAGANALRGATGASAVNLPKSQTGVAKNGFVGRGEAACESAPAVTTETLPHTPNPPAPPLTITPVSPPPVLARQCPTTGNICEDLRSGAVLAASVSPAQLYQCSQQGYVGVHACQGMAGAYPVNCSAVQGSGANGAGSDSGISPWWWLLLAGLVVYAASDTGEKPQRATRTPRTRRAAA